MIGPWLERMSEYIGKGGLGVMGTLLVAALLLWYALGYRMLILKRGSHGTLRKIIETYKKDNRRNPAGVVDTAVRLGLKAIEISGAPLRSRLDEAFVPLETTLSKFTTLVQSIVAVAPLLGLLGTVDGMIETFEALGDMSLFSQSGGIAGGISQALFTTQLGLAVALPGLVVGRILDRRQTLLENELEEIKDILCAQFAEEV